MILRISFTLPGASNDYARIHLLTFTLKSCDSRKSCDTLKSCDSRKSCDTLKSCDFPPRITHRNIIWLSVITSTIIQKSPDSHLTIQWLSSDYHWRVSLWLLWIEFIFLIKEILPFDEYLLHCSCELHLRDYPSPIAGLCWSLSAHPCRRIPIISKP